MEIGIKIKRLREAQKISQMELSAILGISQTKLCHIESSQDKIDFILINKICHYFEVNFNYFLEEKNQEFNKGYKLPITCVDTQNNFPESLIAQINFLVADNKSKEKQIEELRGKIAELEINLSNKK